MTSIKSIERQFDTQLRIHLPKFTKGRRKKYDEFVVLDYLRTTPGKWILHILVQIELHTGDFIVELSSSDDDSIPRPTPIAKVRKLQPESDAFTSPLRVRLASVVPIPRKSTSADDADTRFTKIRAKHLVRMQQWDNYLAILQKDPRPNESRQTYAARLTRELRGETKTISLDAKITDAVQTLRTFGLAHFKRIAKRNGFPL